MCSDIRLKDIDIETVAQFEEHFGVDANDFKYDFYEDLIKDSCLCQIDLDKFFADKKDRFEYDCGDWLEK